MASDLEIFRANETYKTLCAMLDDRHWRYTKDDDDFTICFGVNGEDIAMDFVMIVDADRQLIRVHSMLPFKMKENKRIEAAVATCSVNYRIADGSFDYNILDGTIIFRLTTSFRESKISEELLSYMVDVSTFTIDEYNDKFFLLNQGKLELSEFLD